MGELIHLLLWLRGRRHRYRIEQSPEFTETAARLSPKAKRWLAELYQILAVTPPAWTVRPRRPAAPLAAQRGRADG